jgi:toxin ParE1/3/4
MGREVILTEQATSDLASLGIYVASQSSETIAYSYLSRLHAACMALTIFPERGTKRDDILPGLRTIGFERRATIAFRVLDTQVQIVTIAYGGRDFETDLRKQNL